MTEIQSDDSFTTYYRAYALDVLENAAKEATLTPLMFGHIGSQLFQILCPETFYDDSDEKEPHSLICTAQNIDQVVNTLLQQRILLQPDNPQRNAIKESLKSRFSKILGTIERLNSRLGTHTKLAIETSIETNKTTMPFTARGGSASLESPVIYCEIPFIDESKLTKDEMKTIASLMLAPYEKSRMDFVLTHEFSHILHNDPLTLLTMKAAFTAFATLPWIALLSQPISWPGYFAYALSGSFLVQTVANLAHRIFSQRFETRADKEAMDILGTNEGAIQFFQKFVHLKNSSTRDYLHPPIEDRLLAAQAWKRPS